VGGGGEVSDRHLLVLLLPPRRAFLAAALHWPPRVPAAWRVASSAAASVASCCDARGRPLARSQQPAARPHANYLSSSSPPSSTPFGRRRASCEAPRARSPGRPASSIVHRVHMVPTPRGWKRSHRGRHEASDTWYLNGDVLAHGA
jgi:hypothetical protein